MNLSRSLFRHNLYEHTLRTQRRSRNSQRIVHNLLSTGKPPNPPTQWFSVSLTPELQNPTQMATKRTAKSFLVSTTPGEASCALAESDSSAKPNGRAPGSRRSRATMSELLKKSVSQKGKTNLRQTSGSEQFYFRQPLQSSSRLDDKR